jgi:hypothetical protein
MAIRATTLLCFIFSFAYCQAQLKVNAGRDTTICKNPQPFFIGGEVATGGVPPYTYRWDITPKPYNPIDTQIYFLNQYCSEFLNDTLSINPKVIAFPDHQHKIGFILTVTDSIGNEASDTMYYKKVEWGTDFCNQMPIATFPGDTQSVEPCAFSGGGPPFTYEWYGPGIIGNYTRSIQVMILNTSYLRYVVYITDSEGCITKTESKQYFLVSPLQDGYYEEEGGVSIYPNPARDFLVVDITKTGFSCIRISEPIGRVVLTKSLMGLPLTTTIDISSWSPGLYLLRLESSEGTSTKKILKF